MDKLTVTATVRSTTGKRAAKALRATGNLPAVNQIYTCSIKRNIHWPNVSDSR